jgi:hypothetical protein
MKWRPSSDFEEKLVTTSSIGTASRCLTRPLNASTSINSIGDVTPKLPSTDELFQTAT